MKRAVLLLISLCTLATAYGQKSLKDIYGDWYTLTNKSLTVITFNEDNTMVVNCDDASNMCYDGTYTVNFSTTPAKLNFTTSQGMAAAAILRFNEDGSLDFNSNFGVPGMVYAPWNFERQPQNPANVFFHLVRDKEPLLAELDVEIEIPEEAQLAFERNRRLGVGINLNAVVDGNLHPGYERDAPLGDDEIRSIAEAGFESVRLNVTWSKHCDKSYPYTIDKAFMKKVTHIVDECLANDLAVSIDVHYYPYINMNEGSKDISMEDNYVRLNCLWEQIAKHFRNYPNDMVFFDLMNEPNMIMGAERWNQLVAQLITTIRKTNPDRTLLVMTPDLGQSWTLNNLELPEDEWNVIVEFHYYLPHTFTHQGLSYAMAGGSFNVEWFGTDEEKAPLLKDLDFCRRWSEKNGRPLNMGEYGVVNTADKASRVRYLEFISDACRERGFSSHLWGYREIFMIRDKQTGWWDKDLLNAIMDD